MKNQPNGGEAIRLTNKTARALREQARQQRFALHVAATVITLLLAAFAVLMGMQRLIYVPVSVLAIILIDAVIIFAAHGRYLSLTGQAICTEAAARQMRGETAEDLRVRTAKRDLEKIKADLAASFDDEDDDISLPIPAKKSAEKPVKLNIRLQENQACEPEESREPEENAPQSTLVMEPVQRRRRRQARLQVISSEQAK